MKRLTRSNLAEGFRSLGINPGDKLMVHASLVALGQVDGGAATVIDALLDAVGAEGLVVVPTFATSSPFDRRSLFTPLGAVCDQLWRRIDAVRSLHPTHSVAAIGHGAEEVIRDHEKAPTAYGEGTPYHKLAMSGGRILLLGVDQDRNTTLHTAEALAGAPYLNDTEGTYVDDEGHEITIPVAAMAGPHRDFMGLDRLFRDRGIMRIGLIGKAVCRLIEAGPMVDAALEAMRRDPAAVLCDNPACADCVMQRGKIKAARLANEGFTLAVVAGDISRDMDEVLEAVRGEGIAALELTAGEYKRYGEDLAKRGIRVVALRGKVDKKKSADLAGELKVPLVVPVRSLTEFEAACALRDEGVCVWIENDEAPSAFYQDLYGKQRNAPGLAFNPGHFASAGEKPFLGIFYRGFLRKQMVHFYIDDSTFGGTPTLPGQGNGEVKEILSMLRCRSYNGMMTLRSHKKGVQAFREAAASFWRLIDTM